MKQMLFLLTYSYNCFNLFIKLNSINSTKWIIFIPLKCLQCLMRTKDRLPYKLALTEVHCNAIEIHNCTCLI